MGERAIQVLGGGPAGATAGIAAALLGGSVTIYEKSRLPRHKVCGEFLAPETVAALERIGAWSPLASLGAVPIRRLRLHFHTGELSYALPDTAYGLSRYTLDSTLLKLARDRGAVVVKEKRNQPAPPAVVATGRPTHAQPGEKDRLFGFKTHFLGPQDDAVELYFFDGVYVGVSPVEDGRTNVCGLAPESALESFAFRFFDLVGRFPPLRRRLEPLRPATRWIATGPLRFRRAPSTHHGAGIYPAGDALAFVDPFTGSGLSAAVLTGRLAGLSAVRGTPAQVYLSDCRKLLATPFLVASLLRRVLATRWAGRLVRFVPLSALYRLTRPRVAF